MVRTHINKLFIAGFLSMFSMTISPKCGDEVKSLYNSLLTIQGTFDPMNSNKDIQWGHATLNKNSYILLSKTLHNSIAPFFKTLFSNAATTGLMVQYKQLILSNSSQVNSFIEAEHLQIIAFMQNIFGGGNPFKYDPSKGPLQAGANTHSLATLGTYTNPQNQQLHMTRYGVLNGIIDAMIALDNEGQSSNANYQKFCDFFKQSLIESIKIAIRQNLSYIEGTINPGQPSDAALVNNLRAVTEAIAQLRRFISNK